MDNKQVAASIAEIDEADNQQDEAPSKPVPSNKTPEQFYAQITQREDVRAILEELARR